MTRYPLTETTEVRPLGWVVLVLIVVACLVWLTILSLHLRAIRRRLDATSRAVRRAQAARNAAP